MFSYGFDWYAGQRFWMNVFIIANVAVLILGSLPMRLWKSHVENGKAEMQGKASSCKLTGGE